MNSTTTFNLTYDGFAALSERSSCSCTREPLSLRLLPIASLAVHLLIAPKASALMGLPQRRPLQHKAAALRPSDSRISTRDSVSTCPVYSDSQILSALALSIVQPHQIKHALLLHLAVVVTFP